MLAFCMKLQAKTSKNTGRISEWVTPTPGPSGHNRQNKNWSIWTQPPEQEQELCEMQSIKARVKF